MEKELIEARQEKEILDGKLREKSMELQLESQENDKLEEMKEMVRVSEKLIEEKTNELLKV